VCKFIAGTLLLLLTTSLLWANEVVRDPTAPLGYNATGTSVGGEQFALNSILVSSQRKLAIINGNPVREGDLVPGSTDVVVQKIVAQAVILKQADQTWVLRLSPNILKKH
jgi:MSHA biogenesis protein MshK